MSLRTQFNILTVFKNLNLCTLLKILCFKTIVKAHRKKNSDFIVVKIIKLKGVSVIHHVN